MPPVAATRPASSSTTEVAMRFTSPALVADIDHRHAALVAQALEIGKDFALARRVERGERLVEQQQARLHQQRAADRDALALAARERARPALEQMAEAEQHRRRARGRPASRASPHIQRP